MPLCQAIFCNNRRENCPSKSFFAIPNPEKDRERCAMWLRNIGTTKHNVRTYKYSKHRVVCEDHFAQSAFIEDKMAKLLGNKPRKQLQPDAVPTIFEHKTYEASIPRPATVRRVDHAGKGARAGVAPVTLPLARCGSRSLCERPSLSASVTSQLKSKLDYFKYQLDKYSGLTGGFNVADMFNNKYSTW